MFEQSCSGKSSFSQTLGPAMPEKWPPLLGTLQQCPYKNPYTGSAIMRAKGPQLYSPKSRRRSCHATLCDSAWDGSPQGKDWPPGAVSTGNTKYSSGAIAINGGGFNELEVAPLALITWSHTKMTSSGFGDVVRQPVQGRGVPRILRVWRFPHSRRFSGNLQSLRLIITVWRVKPRRRERIGTH